MSISLPKLCFYLLAFCILISIASGVQYKQSWSRTFGGNYGDGAWSLQETNDSGCIIAGYNCSAGERGDLWLLKTDSNGSEEWDRTFGGSDEDVGYSIKQTREGGYIVTGTTRSYGISEERLWLLKIDSLGKKGWDRTFGGFVSSSGDGGWSVEETDDGYIITGYTRSYGSGGKDLWLIKTNAFGIEQWQKTFGGSKDDVGMSVARALDGGYIVAGRTASFGPGDDDIWLLKADRSGEEQWNRTYGGQKDDVCFQVIPLDDGYALTGRTELADGKKAFLIKVDLQGKKKWERTYGTNSSGISLQRTDDGGFIIAGSIDTPDKGKDALLIKTDSAGKEEWIMPLGGAEDDIGTAVVESRDHGYVLAGITSSFGEGEEDAWLVKLMPDAMPGNAVPRNASSANAVSDNAALKNGTTRDAAIRNDTVLNATTINATSRNITIKNATAQNEEFIEAPKNASKNINKIAANKISLNIPRLADDKIPILPPVFRSQRAKT